MNRPDHDHLRKHRAKTFDAKAEVVPNTVYGSVVELHVTTNGSQWSTLQLLEPEIPQVISALEKVKAGTDQKLRES